MTGRALSGGPWIPMFKDNLHLPVTCIDDSERTLAKLKGVTDPEKKRKAIGRFRWQLSPILYFGWYFYVLFLCFTNHR